MATSPTTEQDLVPGGTGAIVETPQEHGVFPPFDSTTFASQFFWLAITFIVLYWLMAKVITPRIAGILAVRQAKIAADIDQAEKAKAESDAAIAAYESALANARASAGNIAEAARNEAKAAAAAERASTEAALAAKLASAEERIAAIKTKALGEVGQIAGDATQEIVKALVGADVPAAEVEAAVGRALNGGADVR
jgi:F-type H+-transporting ATPase subunit b